VTGSLRSQLYWALASIALTTSVAAACENVTVNLSEVAQVLRCEPRALRR
jgi:hypothetical protein